MNKLNIWVIFGSRTVEHDVSITSAYGIMKGLEKTGKYNVFPIYIRQDGKWLYNNDFQDINNFKDISKYDNISFDIDMTCIWKLKFSQTQKTWIFNKTESFVLDAVFLVLHGVKWEDGSVQGIMELLDVPYVSTSIIWSSIGMNKSMMKDVFKAHNIPITNYITINKNEELNYEKIQNTVSYPLFVKPANLGSSIWISKVKNIEELTNAIEIAFYYDNEIIIEEAVQNTVELNCSVAELNEQLTTSFVEQPITQEEFLTFVEKYVSAEWWTMQWVKNKVKIPAEIPQELTDEIQSLTKKVYSILKCDGWAPRVDFLYDKEKQKLYVNEINTIPGVLQLHLWVGSKYSVEQFLEWLINTAFGRLKKNKRNIDFKSNIIDHTIEFKK